MANIFPTGLTYSRNTKDPLQSKVVWNSYEEALAYVKNVNETAYVGLVLSVIADADSKKNGLWYVETIATKQNLEAGSLKKVGSNETILASDYATALELAKAAEVGSLIKVADSSGSEESGDFHAAGFYIVSVNGEAPSILYLSTTAGDSLDLDGVNTELSNIKSELANKADLTNTLQGVKVDGTPVAIEDRYAMIDLSGKADKSEFDEAVQQLEDKIAGKADSSVLDDYAKTADVVSKTDYETHVSEAEERFDTIDEKIGVQKTESTEATGIYKVISDVESSLKDIISEIPKFDIEVVDELPADNISESTVYLVKEKESDGDLYTEYIYVNGAWENLGKQTVDLSQYSTTEEMNTAISTALADYFTKAEIQAELDKKADATALDDYVLTTTFNTELEKYVTTESLDTYKSEVSNTLKDYVKNTDFDAYKQTVTDSLATKLDDTQVTTKINNALADYVKTETLDNYVQTSVLNDYVNKTDYNNDLNLKADKSELDAYIKKESVNTSESLSFAADGSIEVNAITPEDLTAVINGETTI